MATTTHQTHGSHSQTEPHSEFGLFRPKTCDENGLRDWSLVDEPLAQISIDSKSCLRPSRLVGDVAKFEGWMARWYCGAVLAALVTMPFGLVDLSHAAYFLAGSTSMYMSSRFCRQHLGR